MKDYRIYLKHIEDEVEETLLFCTSVGFEEFRKDRKTQKAVVRGLEVIGEAMSRIPLNIRSNQPEIKWKLWINFGNKLQKSYSNIDETVWNCIKTELPLLQEGIKSVLADLQD